MHPTNSHLTFKHYVNTEKSLSYGASVLVQDLIRRPYVISDRILTGFIIAKSFNLHLNNHFNISNPTVINFTEISSLIASAYEIATKSFPFFRQDTRDKQIWCLYFELRWGAGLVVQGGLPSLHGPRHFRCFNKSIPGYSYSR